MGDTTLVRVVSDATEVTAGDDGTTLVLQDADRIGEFLGDAEAEAAAALASQIDAATSAAAAADDATAADASRVGAEAAEAGTIAAIAGAGGSLGDVTLEAATRSILAALDTTLGLSAVLLEGKRSGPFRLVDYADYSALIDLDNANDQTVFVRSTFNTAKAWMRVTNFLNFRMAGGDPLGATDDTNRIRRTIYLSLLLNLPIRESIKNKYLFSDAIIAGSLTTSTPAAGTADGADIEGVQLKLAASITTASQAILAFRSCADIRVHNIKFDPGTSVVGGGQVQLITVDGFDIHRVRKFGNGTHTTAGSAVSLNTTCTDGKVSLVRVRDCGPTSAAVFMNGVTDTSISDVQCDGGQECVDCSNVNYCTFENIIGRDQESATLELANSSWNSIRGLKSFGAMHGITVKTETQVTPGLDIGSNDNVFHDIVVSDFTGGGIVFQSGATTTQTLHRNRFSMVRLTTTLGTATGLFGQPTTGVAVEQGDLVDVGEYTKGFELRDATIELNVGNILSFPGMEQYLIEDVRGLTGSGAAIVYTGPSSFEKDVQATLRNVRLSGGDVTISRHWGLRLVNFLLTGGRLRLVNPKGLRASKVEVIDAPGDAFWIDFNTNATTNWDIEVDGYTNSRNSVTTANQRGLKIAYIGAGTPAYSGIRLNNILLRDDQGTPTSGGFNFGGATFDYCTLTNSRHVTLKAGNNDNWGWTGLNSVNANNRFRDPTETLFGGTTLSMIHANRRIRENTAGTITVPNDSTTVFPIGTVIEIEYNDDLPTLAAAGGVSIRSKSGWLKVSPRYGVATLKKIAANEWSLWGDLAA